MYLNSVKQDIQIIFQKKKRTRAIISTCQIVKAAEKLSNQRHNTEQHIRMLQFEQNSWHLRI